MVELKPCLFCGGRAKYLNRLAPLVQCENCLAEIKGAKFRAVPINYENYLCSLWNRRVDNG